MNKDKWIDDVLSSGDEMNKVLPSQDLLKRLEAIPESGVQKKGRTLQLRQAWLVAAGIALLIGLNVFTLISYDKTGTTTTASSDAYAAYFDHLKQPEI